MVKSHNFGITLYWQLFKLISQQRLTTVHKISCENKAICSAQSTENRRTIRVFENVQVPRHSPCHHPAVWKSPKSSSGTSSVLWPSAALESSFAGSAVLCLEGSSKWIFGGKFVRDFWDATGESGAGGGGGGLIQKMDSFFVLPSSSDEETFTWSSSEDFLMLLVLFCWW